MRLSRHNTKGNRVGERVRQPSTETGQQGAIAAELGDRADTLDHARLAHLVEQSRTAAALHLLAAVPVVLTFQGAVGPLLLAAWVAALGVVLTARVAGARHVPQGGRCPRRTVVTLGLLAIATAAVWGVTPWLFLGGELGPAPFAILLLLVGFAAAAIPSMACVWPAYAGFLAALLGPACAWLLALPAPTASLLGAMMLLYALALLLAAHRYARDFQRSHELTAELARANVQVGRVNEQLRAQVDESHRAQGALARSERRFQAALDHAPIGMALVARDSSIFHANIMLAQLLGHRGESIDGQRLSDYVLAEDAPEFARTIERLEVGAAESAQLEMRFRTATAATLWASVAIGALEDSDDTPYFIVEIQDVTESIELSARLQYEAEHDHLTGLINRRALIRRLEPLLAARDTRATRHALGYLELERFKVINDVQGHDAGDEVLRQVAGVLQEHLGERDTLARLRGDEFAVLFEDCDTTTAYTRLQAMVRAIAQCRFFWRDRVFHLDLSAGLVSLDADHGGVDEALRAADTACAVAKEGGGGRVHTYRRDDAELQRIQGRRAWVEHITEALESDGFTLYAQPIAATRAPAQASGLHFEILVRMRDRATGQAFTPGAFMEPAERYGLATRLDRWVVEAVFDWFRRHPEAVDRVASCAINLSGMSLDDAEFTQALIQEIRNAPLAPQQLRFEITETAAIGHLAQARRFMERVESLGCRFALDDFGSGLSSFGYLRTLPVDALKIDGQFIRDIVDDRVDRALVRSIHNVGRVMSLETIAEFVEDAATRAVLDEIGVDYVQGHHIGAACPLERLIEERTTPRVGSVS